MGSYAEYITSYDGICQGVRIPDPDESNRELVKPGQNLKSETTAPQNKSGTILVEKAGL
jgi:hypothetical protein